MKPRGPGQQRRPLKRQLGLSFCNQALQACGCLIMGFFKRNQKSRTVCNISQPEKQKQQLRQQQTNMQR